MSAHHIAEDQTDTSTHRSPHVEVTYPVVPPPWHNTPHNSQFPGKTYNLTAFIDVLKGTAGTDLFLAYPQDGVGCQSSYPCSTLRTGDWIDGGTASSDHDQEDELFAQINAEYLSPRVTNVEVIRIQALAPTETETRAIAQYDAAETTGARYIENTASTAPILFTNVHLGVAAGIINAKEITSLQYAGTDGESDSATLYVMGDAATVVINEIETLQVSTRGADGHVRISANALTTLVIDGNNCISIDILDSAYRNLTEIDAHNQGGVLTLYAREDRDLVFHGGHVDTSLHLRGDMDNSISTGSGNDHISTRRGNDTINTGAGDDIIDAGAGDDMIEPGKGLNKLILGPGHDTVIIDSPRQSAYGGGDMTTILDFNATDDKLAFNFACDNGSARHIAAITDISAVVAPLPAHVRQSAMVAQLAAHGVAEGAVYTFKHDGDTYVGVRNQDATLVKLVGLVDISDDNISYGSHCPVTGSV